MTKTKSILIIVFALICVAVGLMSPYMFAGVNEQAVKNNQVNVVSPEYDDTNIGEIYSFNISNYGLLNSGAGFEYYQGNFYDITNMFNPSSCEILDEAHTFYKQNNNPYFIVDRSYDLNRYDKNNILVSTEHVSLFVKIETDITGKLKAYKASSKDSDIWSEYDLDFVLLRSGIVNETTVSYTVYAKIFETNGSSFGILIGFADHSNDNHFHIVN